MRGFTEEPTTEELIRRNQKIIGNVLLFYRNSHQSIAEWHLGPFRGMFPIPWVNVDFDWIIENFDKHVNEKDPVKEFFGLLVWWLISKFVFYSAPLIIR